MTNRNRFFDYERSPRDLDHTLELWASPNHNFLYKGRYVTELEKGAHPIIREVLLIRVEKEGQFRLVTPRELEIEEILLTNEEDIKKLRVRGCDNV